MICIIRKSCIHIPIEELIISKEHIFPESIGGTITTNQVCKLCNNYLGSNVDKFLTDNFFVASERLLHKLKGKKGNLPNPLKDGVLSEDNSKKIQYLMDDYGKPKQIRTVPYFRDFEKDGKKFIEVRVDYKEKEKLYGMVNNHLKRNNQKILSKEEIDNLIKRNIIKQPKVTLSSFIDTVNIHRPLLKIIYELCFRWLGETYSQDKISEIIRLSIIDDNLKENFQSKYPLKVGLNFGNDKNLFPYHEKNDHSHLAMMMNDNDKIICAIRIFKVIEYSVIVSESAKLYKSHKQMFLEINTNTKETRELTFHDELINISKSDKANCETENN